MLRRRRLCVLGVINRKTKGGLERGGGVLPEGDLKKFLRRRGRVVERHTHHPQ